MSLLKVTGAEFASAASAGMVNRQEAASSGIARRKIPRQRVRNRDTPQHITRRPMVASPRLRRFERRILDLAPVCGGRNANVSQKPVRQVTLRRKSRRECDIDDRHLRVTQQLLRAFDAPRKHVLMRRLSDRRLERPGEVKRADLNFARHRVQAQITFEVVVDELDQPPHLSP